MCALLIESFFILVWHIEAASTRVSCALRSGGMSMSSLLTKDQAKELGLHKATAVGKQASFFAIPIIGFPSSRYER